MIDPFLVMSKSAILNTAEYIVVIDMVSGSYYQASFKN